MKPRNYAFEEFSRMAETICGKNFQIKFDSDGKNLVVYSEHRAVFTIARRELSDDEEQLFRWQMLVPVEKANAVFPEAFPYDRTFPSIIHQTTSAKGQNIFWCDDNSPDGIFLAEFNLGGKLFVEQVIPCKEELSAISSEIMGA